MSPDGNQWLSPAGAAGHLDVPLWVVSVFIDRGALHDVRMPNGTRRDFKTEISVR